VTASQEPQAYLAHVAADPWDENVALVAFIIKSNQTTQESSLLARTTNQTTQEYRLLVVRTLDKGKTWSAPTLAYKAAAQLTKDYLSNGCRFDNDILESSILFTEEANYIFFIRKYAKYGATTAEYITDSFPYKYTTADIAFIRSNDNGATWSERAQVIAPFDLNNEVFTAGYKYGLSREIIGGEGRLVNSGALRLSVARSHRGRIYLVYQTGIFRTDQLPEIALILSLDDGCTWSDPCRVNYTPQRSCNPQAFTASVAVTENGYIGISYNDFRFDDKKDYNVACMDQWVALYREVEREDEERKDDCCAAALDVENYIRFIKELRLTDRSYNAVVAPVVNNGLSANSLLDGMVSLGDDLYISYTKTLSEFLNAPTVIYTEQITRPVPTTSALVSAATLLPQLVSFATASTGQLQLLQNAILLTEGALKNQALVAAASLATTAANTSYAQLTTLLSNLSAATGTNPEYINLQLLLDLNRRTATFYSKINVKDLLDEEAEKLLEKIEGEIAAEVDKLAQ
jgi:hypothetical protein